MLEAEENVSKKHVDSFFRIEVRKLVILCRLDAGTLLYDLIMIMFCTTKRLFVPTSQKITHLSQSSATHLWEEVYIMASNVCFSLLYFSICSTFSVGLLTTDVDKYVHFPYSIKYRVIKEKVSTFWQVIVQAIWKKKMVHIIIIFI